MKKDEEKVVKKNIFDIVTIDVNEVSFEDDVKKDSIYFSPKPKSATEPYTALIRFLPIPIKDENGEIDHIIKDDPYYMKKRYWLVNEDEEGKYFDSPMTAKENCPIQQMYYKLSKSNDIRDQKAAENDFSITTHYWSPILVIDDKQKPENNGKIMIYRYTGDIYKMLHLERKPIKNEYEEVAPCFVWDLFEGKNMLLVVGEKKVKLKNGTEKVFYSNYTGTKFLPKSPVKIGDTVLARTKEGAELLDNLLKSIPDEIHSFKYKPWTPEEANEVKQCLAKYKRKGTPATPVINQEAVETTDEDVEDDNAPNEPVDKTAEILKKLKF